MPGGMGILRFGKSTGVVEEASGFSVPLTEVRSFDSSLQFGLLDTAVVGVRL